MRFDGAYTTYKALDGKMALDVKMTGSTTGYCVRCKAKREMKNPQSITMKNGRKATQGTCPVCGTKMFRIGG
jgi:hypothetical protein